MSTRLAESYEGAMTDKKSERDKRLAAALRENLKRRKVRDKAVIPAKAGTSGQEDAGD